MSGNETILKAPQAVKNLRRIVFQRLGILKMIKCSTAFSHLDRLDSLQKRKVCSESISVFPPESIRVRSASS